jgi:hypothetical protein
MIAAAHSDRSAGGSHDYFSEGDYWWPDPRSAVAAKRSGSHSVRAGFSTNREYADHAAGHLHAWFIDKETRMNPNPQYAQVVHGRTTGRGTWIMDTLLFEVAVRDHRRAPCPGPEI